MRYRLRERPQLFYLMDTGFILNRRPFRDNSLLVDLFTKDSGRITCVARVAKKRGKIMQGTLEPFRQLRIDWIGKGEVQTLTLAEEQSRYRIPVNDLCSALYINELLLKLIPKHAPAEDTFVIYQNVLKQLANKASSLADCEMDILESLGYSFRLSSDRFGFAHGFTQIDEQQNYRFFQDSGLHTVDNDYESAEQGVPISGKLLIKLNQRSTLDAMEQNELRIFLDRFIDLLLMGKKLKSRKLAFGR